MLSFMTLLYYFQIKDEIKAARRKRRKRTLFVRWGADDDANVDSALIWNWYYYSAQYAYPWKTNFGKSVFQTFPKNFQVIVSINDLYLVTGD